MEGLEDFAAIHLAPNNLNFTLHKEHGVPDFWLVLCLQAIRRGASDGGV
jgi:hypothetical protein